MIFHQNPLVTIKIQKIRHEISKNDCFTLISKKIITENARMQNKKNLVWKRLRYLCIEREGVLSHQKSLRKCQF